MWDRTREQVDAIQKGNKDYVPVEHWLNSHSENETPPKYAFKVSKVCKFSLERQIREGLEIEYSDTQITLN